MSVTLHVRHEVEDYEGWKPGFDGHESNRRLHGATGHRVLRDGNSITVLIDFPDEAAAEAFAADPALPDAMSKAGVVGKPDINVLSAVEEITY